jgi:hypothetical protein
MVRVEGCGEAGLAATVRFAAAIFDFDQGNRRSISLAMFAAICLASSRVNRLAESLELKMTARNSEVR